MNNLLQEIYTQFPGGLEDPSLTPDALFTLLDDLTSQRERLLEQQFYELFNQLILYSTSTRARVPTDNSPAEPQQLAREHAIEPQDQYASEGSIWMDDETIDESDTDSGTSDFHPVDVSAFVQSAGYGNFSHLLRSPFLPQAMQPFYSGPVPMVEHSAPRAGQANELGASQDVIEIEGSWLCAFVEFVRLGSKIAESRAALEDMKLQVRRIWAECKEIEASIARSTTSGPLAAGF